MGWLGVRFKIVLVVLGLILLAAGFSEYRLTRISSTDPQTLGCDQLIASGYGNNAHIVLDQFWYDLENTVVEYKEHNEDRFTKVYIPVHPIDDAPGTVLLRSTGIHSVAALEQQANHETIQGMVVNAISKVSKEERALLQTVLSPGEEPLIVEIGRRPKSLGTAAAMMAGGLGIAAIPFLPWILGLLGMGLGQRTPSIPVSSESYAQNFDTGPEADPAEEETAPAEGRLRF